jgi:hypothetical protein
MKHPTLQKVTLTAMALVSCLALSAQAGKPSISSAKQKQGSQKRDPLSSAARFAGKPSHKVRSLDSTYMIDDGTAEDAVGFGDGVSNIEALWFNQFDVIPGQTTITSVSVAWGTPAFPDPTLNGEPVTIAIWSDPNNDGNPSDAVLLGSVAGTIQNASTDTFVTYTFSTPITLPAGATSFFAGDMTPAHSGFEQFFSGLDENSTLHRQSWTAANALGGPVNIQNPGQNDTVGLIDDFGLPGNWTIRADTGTSTITPTPPPPPNVLWYNGDFDGVNGLANERDTSLGAGEYASVYDDFDVPASGGWTVTGVFSNNLLSTNVTAATWEIRQGISEGNGGTLVASGMTATPTVTATGRSGFGFTEFTVEVPDLNVHLDPGTYFLNVTPTGDLTGRSFDSTTSGANCVSTPCGNDQNAFFDSNFFGAVFTSTANEGQPYDFSMGVEGNTNTGGITQTAAVSRKTHGAAGPFDVSLPGVECRQGNGGTFTQVIVFTFSEDVTGTGAATTDCGSVTSTTFSGNTVTVTLGHVNCDGSDITVTVPGVTGADGSVDASTVMTLRVGDVNADGVVNSADVQDIRMHVGRGLVDGSDFRDDITVDGHVNHGDVTLAKSKF